MTTTRPAGGPAPDSGHTDAPDAREGLRGLLGDRYEAVIEKACMSSSESPVDEIRDMLAAVLPDLLAEAWDEGRDAGANDLDRLDNPYRTEGTNS